MSGQHENPSFIGDDGVSVESQRATDTDPGESTTKQAPQRDIWGKSIEFLMSCIAMSVGLGNIWRFPFTALENGGGAFLIPYLIVLFLVGKPIYYLEMIIGQFCSRGSVKVYDLCPAMRGIGIGQAFMVFLLASYFQSICAIIAYYLVESFRDPLPWSYCRPEWGENCIDSSPRNLTNVPSNTTDRVSASSEWYFTKKILREKKNINDGIGAPNWDLALCLFISWICIFLVVMRGVRSSGKAAYFLALFPYVIMGILLVRAVTLPGAMDGIMFFIKPDWSKILDPKVWYAAVTQCFVSLSVCFGNIIMYASYNKFDHNVYRDATIVTALDTGTSLLAGFTIFGVLGHLAHEIGTTDIGSVVNGGVSLAFISYPDAITKLKQFPQVFAVLFFFMLFVLGVGSNIALASCVSTAIRDKFPKVTQWRCSLGIVVVSFCIGLAYVTPGGQFILILVDYYSSQLITIILGIFELYIFGWVYTTKRICKDAEFMLGRKVGLYWRLCWSNITPIIMTLIVIYFFATYTNLTYDDLVYPDWANGLGWTITAIGVLQVPIWFCVAVIQQPEKGLKEKILASFRPKPDWGPVDPLLRELYTKEMENSYYSGKSSSFWSFYKENTFG